MVPSSYAKIWGETKFQLPECPRSGSKAMSIEREKERRRAKVNDYNGQHICLNQFVNTEHSPFAPYHIPYGKTVPEWENLPLLLLLIIPLC